MKMPQPPQNVLAPADVRALAALGDFEAVKNEIRVLLPVRLFGLGRLTNRFLAPFPLVRQLCLRHFTVCRSLRQAVEVRSASIVIPARNERGNIEAAVKRIPHFTEELEIIFVEGHSKDGTWDEIERVAAAYPERGIKAMRQPGTGKANAVFAGFDAARGDVLMILDADLTVPPEQLPKFWDVIRSGKGEFVNGSRLVYPMEHQAMRFLNLVANKIFSLLFTWLLSQRFTDTLCGAKALCRSDYTHEGRAQILWRFRSVRGFRADLRRIEARPQSRGDSHPLYQPYLWRDPDLPVPARLYVAAHGVVRIHAHQGDLMRRQQSDPLPDHRSIWERKGALRLVYDDFYDRIAAARRPGLTIEIGGGIGKLCAPWLDCVADAQLPDARTANIVKVAAPSGIAGRLLPRGRPP
jgi:Glycosyl transferase family 2